MRSALDQHDLVVDQTRVGEHPAVDECERHHSVSVTLLRCGGASGLKPRASARLEAIR